MAWFMVNTSVFVHMKQKLPQTKVFSINQNEQMSFFLHIVVLKVKSHYLFVAG